MSRIITSRSYLNRWWEDITLLPNLISIGRIILIIPIGVLYAYPSQVAHWTVVALLLLSYLSDYADGFVARKFNQQSELGLILDPVADKLWTLVMIFLLYRYRELPLWMGATFIGRDFILLLINGRLLKRHGKVMSSDEYGRMYMVFLGLLVIGMTLRVPLIYWLSYGLVLFALLTLLRYYLRYRRMIQPE